MIFATEICEGGEIKKGFAVADTKAEVFQALRKLSPIGILTVTDSDVSLEEVLSFYNWKFPVQPCKPVETFDNDVLRINDGEYRLSVRGNRLQVSGIHGIWTAPMSSLVGKLYCAARTSRDMASMYRRTVAEKDEQRSQEVHRRAAVERDLFMANRALNSEHSIVTRLDAALTQKAREVTAREDELRLARNALYHSDVTMKRKNEEIAELKDRIQQQVQRIEALRGALVKANTHIEALLSGWNTFVDGFRSVYAQTWGYGRAIRGSREITIYSEAAEFLHRCKSYIQKL